MEVGKSRSACLSVSRMFGQPLNPVVSHCVQILAHKPSQESASTLLFEKQDERLQTETFHRTASCRVSAMSKVRLAGRQHCWQDRNTTRHFGPMNPPASPMTVNVFFRASVRKHGGLRESTGSCVQTNFAPTWFTTSVSATEVSIHHWSPSLLSLKLKLPPDLLFPFQTGNDANPTSALVSPNIWIQERSPKSLLTNACV